MFSWSFLKKKKKNPGQRRHKFNLTLFFPFQVISTDDSDLRHSNEFSKLKNPEQRGQRMNTYGQVKKEKDINFEYEAGENKVLD